MIKLKPIYLSSVIFLILSLGTAGCAENYAHRTTSTQSTVDNGNGGTVTTTTPGVTPAATSTTTTTPGTSSTSTTSTTATTTHEGPVMTVFHAIGTVLAFPFFLIGNIIQTIL
jgi:hypothetical protein